MYRYKHEYLVFDRQFITPLAQSLYRGYARDTAKKPGRWLALNEGERKLWKAEAKRALQKVEQLVAIRRIKALKAS